MPEVAEVYTMAKAIWEKIGPGASLTDLIFYKKPGKDTKHSTYISLDQLKLKFPATVESVCSKGKKIIIQLKDNIYIVISPLMTGGIIFKKGDYSHVHFKFADEKKAEHDIYFDDKLSWGIIDTYFDQKSYEQKMCEIGPDWINDDITLESFVSKIKYSRIKNNMIGIFLKNPKWFSGIGNWLRAEILYDAKISPYRILSSLTDDEIKAIYNSCVKIVKLSLESKGLTIKDYQTPDGEPGTYDTKVYDKEKDPDGNQVVKEKLKKETQYMHWCPTVQK